MLAEQAEAPDIPVVLRIRDRGLEQNLDRAGHASLRPKWLPGRLQAA
jgi:hypothetical protein